ncbi:GumC family protein [Cecembia lonarensis]|uniref:non-specific protein-tyrosine kinase n=1 Tax=Cecembia lonarensis (strain CCUG 58316 / KCTC 22772 / LW9) TaxID=1225176 RepID=K1L8X0_CECL9|nr:tyrosine-protein kinase family protein [Cecembia lonarensis]EKB48622.1 Tyrosine-protein kinase ptk [Cecembia lonarensis LW9]
MNPNTTNHSPQQTFQEEDDLHQIKDLARRYLRNWYWVGLSLFVFLAGAFLINRYTPKVYRSTAQFFVKEEDSGMNLFDQRFFGYNSELDMTNQMIILRSRPIAELALNKLDFQVEYYLEGYIAKAELYPTAPILVEVDWRHPQLINGEIQVQWSDRNGFRLTFPDEQYSLTQANDPAVNKIDRPKPEITQYAFGEWIETPYMRIKVNLTSGEDIGKILVKLRDKQGLINQYAGAVNITPVEKFASILQLSTDSYNSKKGTDYLNALMEAYLENELGQKNRTASNTINFIDEQLAGLSDTLSFIENRLETFRSANRIYDISNQGSSVFGRLADLDRELAQEKLKREYYRNLQNYLVKEDYNEIIVPSGLGIDDPILNNLIKNLLELQNQKASLMTTQREASPAVREVNRKLQDLNNSIRELLVNVDENAAFLINDLQRRISQIDLEFSRLPAKEQNLLRIQREFSFSEGIYSFLAQKRAEAAITKASNTPNNKIIEFARTLPSAVTPRPMRNYALALSLGLLIPFLFVLGKVYLTDKVKDIKELERKAQAPILASVAFRKLYDELVVFADKNSGITEAFRSLRANMNFVLPKDQSSVILVTSNTSGEGKTFCSMNLASVYSLAGKKTILIGTDLRKPKIAKEFALKNDKGLSNYLSGQQAEWQTLIKGTDYENLDVLLSGPIPPNPSELIGNGKMPVLLEALKKEYDIIILDTPPIGMVSETLEMFPLADAVFFVVRFDYTLKSGIDHINHLKTSQKLQNAYIIFNAVDEKEMQYNYGYGYGYGYGYNDSQPKANLLKTLMNKWF